MIKKAFAMPLLPALLLSSALFLVSTAAAQPAQGLDPSSYRLVGTITAGGLIGVQALTGSVGSRLDPVLTLRDA